MFSHTIEPMWRLTRRLMWIASLAMASAFGAFVIGDAMLSRTFPDLEHWHRVAPEGELTAVELSELDFSEEEEYFSP